MENPFTAYMSMCMHGAAFMNEVLEYQIDFGQRMTLFLDTKREQGDNFIEENRKGLPPVLHFDYEVIFNGRDLDNPVNYSLARITPEEGQEIPPDARPVVIIDPRAGHGPGIGGFRKESEVGMAMRKNHPVYFLIFTQEPVRGQTLAHVFKAHIEFLKVIRMFHPEAERPSIIGNCQGGWAAALIAADRPDITGPLILNGSPLSYWAGRDTQNPMRYRGGLFGGVWLASLSADLGNGLFDGAQLVWGFEDLNPANSLWMKDYNLWRSVDKERDRYIFFERWWNGFVFMTKEEIQFVVRDLFVGNRLEEGQVEGGSGEIVDLRKLKDPVILFASRGDNITPPEQALGWIERVWGSVSEIKKRNQVIVYLLHEEVGHLGIFVSRKVVEREHKELIDCVDLAKRLAPGLYQMILKDDGEARFEVRDLSQLRGEGSDYNARPFEHVRKASEMIAEFYETSLSPMMKPWGTEVTATVIRESSPLRQRLYAVSGMNPVTRAASAWAPYVRANRMEAPEDNTLRKVEHAYSDTVAALLNGYRDLRDSACELLFYGMYDNPMAHFIFQEALDIPDIPLDVGCGDLEAGSRGDHWISRMVEGGFFQGLMRGLVALGRVKQTVDKQELITLKALMKGRKHLQDMTKREAKRVVGEQVQLLNFNRDLAISTLPELIRTPEDRLTAITIFRASLQGADREDLAAKRLLSHLEELLRDRQTL
ncbi:DUF3141 domain-containing protein [Desulfoluna spongiiphila]|uniref:Poly(3-hydroxyalkanoate) synthetase n=1 Tax=Desulfoluna spongiiphila TaxID=419481 RepID=A0A1G5CY57_9BACT|nr:DUF3141 domain-containing protein [Desulfoluna spongiiphila]SCY07354.1 Protein of unknown function [Desulfoluna spongiiphila]VVS92478.1 alpha/beta hydrolase fold [Desulfoluna spongiiphila]